MDGAQNCICKHFFRHRIYIYMYTSMDKHELHEDYNIGVAIQTDPQIVDRMNMSSCKTIV